MGKPLGFRFSGMALSARLWYEVPRETLDIHAGGEDGQTTPTNRSTEGHGNLLLNIGFTAFFVG